MATVEYDGIPRAEIFVSDPHCHVFVVSTILSFLPIGNETPPFRLDRCLSHASILVARPFVDDSLLTLAATMLYSRRHCNRTQRARNSSAAGCSAC